MWIIPAPCRISTGCFGLPFEQTQNARIIVHAIVDAMLASCSADDHVEDEDDDDN